MTMRPDTRYPRAEPVGYDDYPPTVQAARGEPLESPPRDEGIGFFVGAVNAAIFTGAVGFIVWVIYAWVMWP